MQVRDFIKHLKNGERPPLTLILGEEQALRQQAQQALANLIPEDQKAMNFGRYDMHQTPVALPWMMRLRFLFSANTAKL
ncbi:hypothetical protein BT102_09290 [Lacticaseibacillus rhamnosus]|nr:hypothetical protein BT102_09290 [Lacticaseibacillus rhamnosus]